MNSSNFVSNFFFSFLESYIETNANWSVTTVPELFPDRMVPVHANTVGFSPKYALRYMSVSFGWIPSIISFSNRSSNWIANSSSIFDTGKIDWIELFVSLQNRNASKNRIFFVYQKLGSMYGSKSWISTFICFPLKASLIMAFEIREFIVFYVVLLQLIEK